MLYKSQLNILGSAHPKDNPYPVFMEQNRNPQVPVEPSMKDEDMELLGYEIAPRYLPYKMKDRYDRNRVMRSYETIVMENEILKATFLPEYGGRLYSLYHKTLKQELLFTNPVIQPANLAILDAWISGGIEWNMGQLGHSFTTCEPLFCSIIKDDEGQEFLRMFEYERCHGLFWHMDFHLPEGSSTLQMYVRIINDTEKPVSTYWWTNTAVREDKSTRIFAGAGDVIYMDMESLRYGRDKMPNLGVIDGRDGSYPSNFDYSNEYFFQEQNEPATPWETAVYSNWAFFERSTQALEYRKMFCWGTHQGGQHWKDYLSEKDAGNYVEIQAGLAKTQRHGLILPAGQEIEFVQCFGGFEKQPGELYGEDWNAERLAAAARVNEVISDREITALKEKLAAYGGRKPEQFICYGSGFGALEALRRKKLGEKGIPNGFFFPDDSMKEEQQPWASLLNQGKYEETEARSYMIDNKWQELLLQSIKKEPECSAEAYLQLGIMLVEQGEADKATEAFEQSLTRKETPLAYRNLAYLCGLQKQDNKVREYYEKAMAIGFEEDNLVLATEYFKYLAGQGDSARILELYYKLPETLQSEERIYLRAVNASLATGDLEFVKGAFDREYAYIRESDTDISDIWLRYNALKEQKETGREVDATEMKNRYQVPYELDFRMICR